MAERPVNYREMDLRQQLLYEAQQQTDAMARIIELLEVFTSPAEVAGFPVAENPPFEESEQKEVVPTLSGNTPAIETEESAAIEPEPVAVTVPRRSLISRLFGQR